MRLLEFLRATDSNTLYLVGNIIDGWQLRRRWSGTGDGRDFRAGWRVIESWSRCPIAAIDNTYSAIKAWPWSQPACYGLIHTASRRASSLNNCLCMKGRSKQYPQGVTWGHYRNS